ncbi:unnamed protein product [Oikopleura dioica]|uniref:Olfactomedin-like domain-containing protein n=1 Tax=Oikopleura dioica TaxID=34765 RepID=E4XYF4_OIKDI|nr:unnamed protein product [Oikopleura dioica]
MVDVAAIVSCGKKLFSGFFFVFILFNDLTTYALVNGKLHIFGGNSDYKKIARLDDCTLNELTVRLNEERKYGHAALSIENGTKALICFGNYNNIRKTCENFRCRLRRVLDASPRNIKKLKRFLRLAGLRLDHPKRISYHSLVALENQSLLLIAGRDYGNGGADQSGIWQLKDENWNQIGDLLQADFYGSAIYIGRSIYYFGYSSMAIERLYFNQDEDLQTVEEIGKQQGYFFLPVLLQTVSDYCI